MDQTTKTDLAAFKAWLRDTAAPSETIADSMRLSWAMRALGGGPKPWGAALHALLESGVPYELTGPEKMNYIIDRADVAHCCSNV